MKRATLVLTTFAILLCAMAHAQGVNKMTSEQAREENAYALGIQLPVSVDSDDALAAGFNQIGLSVGKGFEWQTLDDVTKRGLSRAIKTAEQSSTASGPPQARRPMVGSTPSSEGAQDTIRAFALRACQV